MYIILSRTVTNINIGTTLNVLFKLTIIKFSASAQ